MSQMRRPWVGDVEAVEAVAAVAHHLAGLADIAELLGELQQSSSAIHWAQLFSEDGVCEPMPRGGSTSPLEKYSQQILALIREQRDARMSSPHHEFVDGLQCMAAGDCRSFGTSATTSQLACRQDCGRGKRVTPLSRYRFGRVQTLD